jgi:periplasmic divalent cation tolerance protein
MTLVTGDVCEVIITADDEGWLIDFTRSLVTDRLAACGQHQPIRSVFRWQGVISEERETRVALHTRTSLVDKIIDRVRQAHPYDVPCVLALPVVGGNPAYLEWVLAETDG